MNSEKPTYLNEKQVASELGISIQTLRNHRSLRKGLPYTKLGKKILYKWSDVLDFLENRKVSFSS